MIKNVILFSLKCYTHCILTNYNWVRKGQFNADLATKQIKLFLPPHIQESLEPLMQKCRDAGEFFKIIFNQKILFMLGIYLWLGNRVENLCERIFAVVECFYKNSGGSFRLT